MTSSPATKVLVRQRHSILIQATAAYYYLRLFGASAAELQALAEVTYQIPFDRKEVH